ncbi:hypothetical protein A0J61_03590 [Choanephora cucurbitarum]|uniref:Zinc finger C2H2 LYAR-type domain-containing protein n=1 Tax=Choanephora cucurbitarum TaxID=101091 RepID=A0A1C7NH87_9FUNG|nr:hypothetical protein A0J61_03590 [Choanephora cucurbitarum]
MVSFQCDGCGDVVKKPKLNQHRGRCHATFTCIDCSTTFQGNNYQSHTSCITEAQKFQKHVYQNKNNNNNNSNKKPASLIDQLNQKKKDEQSTAGNDKKRKNDQEDKKSKKSKTVTLTAWSNTELENDLSKTMSLALKEVLKSKPLSLKDARKKTIELINKHPQSKKFEKSDLKKEFEKKFSLTLNDDQITLA